MIFMFVIMQECDRRLWNVIILGISFMFTFTAFQTCAMAEKAVLQSSNNGTFKGDGYVSLGIIYAVFSVSNWGAPSFVSIAGAKIAMICGSVLYFVFILSFFKPMVWTLYTGSALVGIGAAVLWTAQGMFLSANSDSVTAGRNSGIFWAIFQCSLMFGNMYSFFVFKGEEIISDSSRIHLFIGLSASSLLGCFCLLFLRMVPITRFPEKVVDGVEHCDCENEDSLQDDSSLLAASDLKISSRQKDSGLVTAFKRVFQLLLTRDMLLLSIVFAYTGIHLTFFSGVYGTCIAHNKHFGEGRKSLLGVSGMLIGAGEIAGGLLFGIFSKQTKRVGHDFVVLLGYCIHLVAFYLVFLNLPMSSPIMETEGPTYLMSSQALALICSFLIGFGDSSFNTQVYSLIITLYPEDSASAFALFKFVQSVFAAVAFYYSSVLLLKWQLLILVVVGTGGVFGFSIVEKRSRHQPT